MKNILHTIIETKRREVEQLKDNYHSAAMGSTIKTNRKPLSLAEKLKSPGIIAEFKRRSPSRGWINQKAEVGPVVDAYMKNGAVAVSVLTDATYFGGSLSDLREASGRLNIPLLRKDFIVDELQVEEAYLSGADVILLIAAALNKGEIRRCSRLAHDLGLEVLLELHGEEEISKVQEGIDIIGINNRDLRNFKVDIDRSIAMAKLLPGNVPLVSESGLDSPGNLLKLLDAGFNGFLVGEHFMSANDPGQLLAEWVAILKRI
jgi:indole-3-glycerol phosphate synthase